MEVTDLNDLLNVRTIKMESTDGTSFSGHDNEVESPLSEIPQFVTETDLGLMQPGAEILQTPLAVFSDAPDDEDTMNSMDSSEEVIVQLMDIRTRLSSLRALLERRLGADLSDYSFWLQDAKMLENHKTLVEQCIRGEGMVQVNVQVRAADRKINILDVLKPDEELIQLADADEMQVGEVADAPAEEEEGEEMEEAREEEEQEAGTPLADTPVLCATRLDKQDVELEAEAAAEAAPAAVRWMVDPQFQRDQARLNIPDDPALWSVQHVRLWIQWAVRQFRLPGVRLQHWTMSGERLAALTNHEFKQRVPSDPGDIFWTHFELLRKCKFIAIVQNDENIPKETINVAQAAIKRKPKQIMPRASDEEAAGGARSGNNGQVQLWQFLLEMLTSAQHLNLIRWQGSEGEFKLLEPEAVARRWGARKHKPAMNYEKLSRALRYYYDGDMIAKVPGKRFVYKFVCDLRQLIGYNAAELSALVSETLVQMTREGMLTEKQV